MELKYRSGPAKMVKSHIKLPWLNYAHIKHTNKAFNSTTILEDGTGQITGTLGEMAFGRWLMDMDIDFDYCADSSMNYDFVVGGYRVDVKSKKALDKHGEPRDDFTLRIPCSQKNQDCDIYVFTYVYSKDVYLLGSMEKSDFWGYYGHDVKAGEKTGNFTERQDARLAYIRDLTDMERLEILLRNRE